PGSFPIPRRETLPSGRSSRSRNKSVSAQSSASLIPLREHPAFLADLLARVGVSPALPRSYQWPSNERWRASRSLLRRLFLHSPGFGGGNGVRWSDSRGGCHPGPRSSENHVSNQIEDRHGGNFYGRPRCGRSGCAQECSRSGTADPTRINEVKGRRRG